MMDSVLKIPFLPDLAMPKYRARYGGAAAERAGNIAADVAALLNPDDDEWAVLRYLYVPDEKNPQNRLTLFLRIHSGTGSSGESDVLPGQHFLDEFYAYTPAAVEDACRGIDIDGGYLFSIQRAEEIFHDPDSDLLYYAPVVFDNGTENIVVSVNLDALLHSLQAPCIVDVTVRPSVLHAEEGQELFSTLKDLDRRISAFDPERRDVGSLEDLARERDMLASRHKDFFQKYFDTLYSGRIYEFGVRVFSQDKREGNLVARSLGEAIEPGGQTAIVEHNSGEEAARQALADCEHNLEECELVTGATCYSRRLADVSEDLQQTLGEQFNRAVGVSRLCNLTDMENMSRLLTVPTSEGVYLRTVRLESEMRAAESTTDEDRSVVSFGTETERPGSIQVGLDQLQKHLFVAGVTGSGKTTSMLSLLSDLWEKHRIPFLVLEPAKSEYRTLLAESTGDLADNLRIYSPGNERLSPFRFNPLEGPPGVTVEEHISGLESSFAGAIPMSGGPLPSLITEAIMDCYQQAGFGLGDSSADGKHWPTMDALVSSARRIMDDRGYVGEVRSNLQTAIDVRLQSLCQRSVGRMFSFEKSLPSIEQLLSYPTILEMDSLNLDQQNLLILFLLTSIREWLSRRGPAEGLQHAIVIEEAHNLVGAGSAESGVSEDFADPRGYAARFMVRLLAEIRAFGEGIMALDQSPAAIAPEVLKNTSVKIVHRTVSEDDRDALASAMLMDRYAHEELARLEVGDAYVYHERLYRPIRVRCTNSVGDVARANDTVLLEKFSEAKWFQHGQEMRLEHIRNKLETLMNTFRDGLGDAVKGIKACSELTAVEEYKSAVIHLADSARSKLNEILCEAVLDNTIRTEVKLFDKEYRGRMDKLLEEVFKVIRNNMEVEDGSENEK